MKSMTFTSQEYDVLNKISHNTKMDCWFCLALDDEGNDIIVDLEENSKQLEIEEAVETLIEGISDESNFDICDLTLIECVVLCRLLNTLGISIPEHIAEKQRGLDFGQVLKLLQAIGGIHIAREAWINSKAPNKEEYIFIKHSRLFKMRKVTKDNDAHLLSTDFFAKDWCVI